MLAAEGHQFVGDVRARPKLGHQLNHGLDLLAQILVRRSEHGGVGDLGMGDQEVLAFLRIDVDAAGDDHERGAVGEVDEALLVDMADVADGAHRPVGRVRLRGLIRIVEIFERRSGLEPELAGLAARHFLHLLVEHMQLAGTVRPTVPGWASHSALSHMARPMPSVAP